MTPRERSGEHYARVERSRLPGESFMHALDRLAIEDAEADTVTNAEAARVLGYSEAAGFWMARDRMRKFVEAVKNGTLQDHRRGPKPMSSLRRMASSPIMRQHQEEAS